MQHWFWQENPVGSEGYRNIAPVSIEVAGGRPIFGALGLRRIRCGTQFKAIPDSKILAAMPSSLGGP